MADETTYKFTKELEFQMSLGAHLFPEYPQRSLCESFYGLRKTMGDYYSNMDAMDISPSEYRKNKFVIGIDTEKCSAQLSPATTAKLGIC